MNKSISVTLCETMVTLAQLIGLFCG